MDPPVLVDVHKPNKGQLSDDMHVSTRVMVLHTKGQITNWM